MGKRWINRPPIILHAEDDLADIKECYEAGCNSCITKPSALDEFNAAIENVAAYWLEICALPWPSGRPPAGCPD